MDKWWLGLTVLLAVCAANISGERFWGEEFPGPDVDDYEYDDYATNNKQEEQLIEDMVYVRPEDRGNDGIDIAKSEGIGVADKADEYDHNEDGNDFEPRNYDSINEEEIPSIHGLADDDEMIDTEAQNGHEENAGEQIINEDKNSNSEENADDAIFEAIRQALAEDTDLQNEDRVDEDYQVEDNRSQVQNKFNEENGDKPTDDIVLNVLQNTVVQENEDADKIVFPQDAADDADVNVMFGNNDDKNTTMESKQINEREPAEEILPQEVNDDQFDHAYDNIYDEEDVNDNEDQILADIFGSEAKSNSDKNENILNNADSKNEENNESVEKMPVEEIYETRNEEALNNQISDEDKENSEQSKEIDVERKVVEESFVDAIITSDEDTVNEVYDDLKGDLDELFDTLNKLVENDSDEISVQQPFDEEIKNASQNDDVDEIEESKVDPEAEKQEFVDSGEERILKLRQDYYDSMKDYNLDYVQDDIADNDQNEEEQPNLQNEEDVKIYKEEETDNVPLDNVKEEDVKENLPEPLVYLNDGLLNENRLEQTTQTDEKKNKAVEIVQDYPTSVTPDIEAAKDETADLTSAEVNNRMMQFAIDHSDDLDVNSKNFDRDVAPVYITLKLGEAVVIESPNYPNVYPANNIVDWIIDGEGIGIEMNVTDLAVNGNLGDYLLIKPGGIDESGTDGLIFSYQLRSERRYRFLDVNRIFIRFQTQPGLPMLGNRGFQLRLELLNPLPEPQEPIPEPEAIVQPPRHTMQVFLAGMTPRQLANNSEEFRAIVADMATLYVNTMGLESDDVNTTAVTQITRIATCNVNWPGFERCAGVVFGVPLADDEESGLTEDQLRDMWSGSVDVDPFAARLRRMGMTEFVIPNDRSTLLLWLVIGAGVAISAGMLALALWRWSCFEDYTRMPAFSDTDSVIGDHKRNLDLYPTPHQTLPPLYDDDFVKYEDSARVDMGGFTNKSFAREGELLDLESDDDLGVMPVKRDRSSNIQPKDIYQV